MKRWMVWMLAFAALPACETGTYAHPAYAHAHGGHDDGDGDGDHDHDHDGHHHDEAPITAEARAAGERVLVLQTSDGRPSEVLGLVDVHEPMGDQERALADLKARAAMIGADALIGVEFHHDDGGGPHAVTHLSGMAVRFHDLLNGRPYVVLGALDVTNPMGEEEELYDQLRDRARALHANLIINIHFEHGEGGPLRLTGTAVQVH